MWNAGNGSSCFVQHITSCHTRTISIDMCPCQISKGSFEHITRFCFVFMSSAIAAACRFYDIIFPFGANRAIFE